ncbi:MAG: hypothetical protein K6G16_01230 [Lachnospiraceae bacterium]|nr:hypothetical protein [Lachnospiraceae bacterium]
MAGFAKLLNQEAAPAQTCEELDVIMQALLSVTEGDLYGQWLNTDRDILIQDSQAVRKQLASETDRVVYTEPDGTRHIAHRTSDALMEKYHRDIEELAKAIDGMDEIAMHGSAMQIWVEYDKSRRAYLEQRAQTVVGDEITTMADARRVSAHVQELTPDVDFKAIRELNEKVLNESTGSHKNSQEYDTMKARLAEVARLSSLPADHPERINNMGQAMQDLYQAAEAYADKEAFKTKKTPQGIQRKNTALALMKLTDPQRADAHIAAKGGVKDLRESTFKKRVSLDDLVAHEKGRNSAEFGVKADERRRRTREARAQQAPTTTQPRV